MNETKTILIIDDEVDFRHFVHLVLASAAFEVKLASDGEDGINIAKEIQPDLILLDYNMPGMDGMEVLKRLRSDESTRSIPTAFFTGTPMLPDDMISALELDPADFITKQISAKELVARIHWILRNRQWR